MKAHELLSDKSKWTQKTFARDVKGDAVSPQSAGAVCFCIVGALNRCYYQTRKYFNKHMKVQDAVGGHISAWNDAPNRTFEEVHELLKRLDV